MATHDVPLTPTGRLFSQPEVDQIINCYMASENPIDVNAVKFVIQNSIMVKHPRFTSLMVKDRHGREHWRKTVVDLNRHVIVVSDPVGPVGGDCEEAVNEYVADLAVSSELSTEKPMWEVHLLMAHNCAVLRLHHALGDGTSLMSMLACCGRVAGDSDHPLKNKSAPSSFNYRGRVVNGVWGFAKMMWLTLFYMWQLLWRILWVKDKTTPLSGGAGVELWPRKLATAKFQFDDMVTVKNAIPCATINDVLCGVISSGLSRYINLQSPKSFQGFKITGLAMVNLRPQPGLGDISKLAENNCARLTWVNNFSTMLLPMYLPKTDEEPIDSVKRAKQTNDRKKLSLEPRLTYTILNLIMSCFGSKLTSAVIYRMVCHTSFAISNIVGPRNEIAIAGNPVKFIRVTSSGVPHAITMHLVTYAGRADLQILVAKDIIPEPQLLATIMEDALLEMKKAATISLKLNSAV